MTRSGTLRASVAPDPLEAHPISPGQAVCCPPPPVDLEDETARYASPARGRRHRLGVRHDSDHAPTLALLLDEDHVEREERVLHPERVIAALREDEEHAVVRAELLAEHEAPPALGGREIGRA